MIRRYTLLTLAFCLVGAFTLITINALGATGSDDGATTRPNDPAASKKSDHQPRYTTGEKALLAIQSEGRLRVSEISAQLKNTTDPEQRRELHLQAVAIKKQTRLYFLETLAGFARERGDQVTERQALDQIENLKHPRRAQGTPIRQTPDKNEIQRGGQ